MIETLKEEPEEQEKSIADLKHGLALYENSETLCKEFIILP